MIENVYSVSKMNVAAVIVIIIVINYYLWSRCTSSDTMVSEIPGQASSAK